MVFLSVWNVGIPSDVCFKSNKNYQVLEMSEQMDFSHTRLCVLGGCHVWRVAGDRYRRQTHDVSFLQRMRQGFPVRQIVDQTNHTKCVHCHRVLHTIEEQRP